MPITIVTDPTYPVAGEEVELTITGGTAYQVARFRLTGVPNSSDLETGAVDSRYETAGDPGSTLIHYFTPDVGGPYAFALDVYTEYRVATRESPTAPTEVRSVLAESTTGTVHVGRWFELPIRTIHGHGATLGLLISNSTVRDLQCTNFLTDISRVAFLQSAVVSAYEALESLTIADLDDDFTTDVRNILAKVVLHFDMGPGVHGAPDTDTSIGREAPWCVRAAIETVHSIHDAMLSHMIQGPNRGTWHTVDDTKNMPIVGKGPAAGPTALGEAMVLRADLRERVYERHREQNSNPIAHNTPDTTNALAAPKPLTTFIVAYLDAIASAAPMAPTGESEGHGDIQHAFGFSPRD